jgi:hypothetical protein
MRMFLNGCKTSRSESPVTIQAAFPDNANSRYILSLGSRHTEMECVTSTSSDAIINESIKEGLELLSLKYRSNFDLNKMVLSSNRVFFDIKTVWFFTAFSKALNGMESLSNAALIKTLLSNTIFIYFFNNSFNFSSVSPCLAAYFPISSITCKIGLGSETHRSISCVSSNFLSSVNEFILSAVSFFTSNVIAFMGRSIDRTNIQIIKVGANN